MQPPHVYVCEWFRSLAIQLIFKFSVTKFSCKYWKFIFFQNWWWSRKLCHLIIKFTGFGCMIKWNTSCEIYIDNWQWLIIYQSCKILYLPSFFFYLSFVMINNFDLITLSGTYADDQRISFIHMTEIYGIYSNDNQGNVINTVPRQYITQW